MPADLPPGPSGSISLPGDLSSGMTGGGAGGVWPQRKCVDITVPLCRGIGYNHTYMPNEFHQETQEEISAEVRGSLFCPRATSSSAYFTYIGVSRVSASLAIYLAFLYLNFHA